MFGSNNNKKNGKNVGNVIESYGKTEPVSGNPFGQTEPIFGGGAMSLGEIPPTMPAAGMGFVDIPGPMDQGTVTTPIQDYGPTAPAEELFTDFGGEKVRPVVGWLVCVKGANVGKEYRIHSDYNYVGSAYGDIVILGDPKISREKHMLITYDPENRKFYVAPASGANIVRLNDKSLVGGAEELKNYDVIRTGDTSLMFIAFCGPEFGWEDL